MRSVFMAWCIVLSPFLTFAADPPPFELRDGDRVVFLGNTLIEREQKYGHWELMLTMAWPERNVTFRNLGWSGDTVWGESRAGFGTQADGFKALVEQVTAAKPTVIFVGYGNVEAFAGEPGLTKFIEGFNKLLDELERTKARIVVLGPTGQNPHVTPNKDWRRVNESVGKYSEAMSKVCDYRNHLFVAFASLTSIFNDVATTDDDTGVSTKSGDLTAVGYLLLYRNGIAPRLQLSRDVSLPQTPEGAGQYVALKQAITTKNEFFFHRWRPQNETYLFGFRKHEQGKNAAELFAFDPLIAAEERKIAELRVKLAAGMKETKDAK
jgi:hypothetical protein